jgi:hypothetical protein
VELLNIVLMATSIVAEVLLSLLTLAGAVGKNSACAGEEVAITEVVDLVSRFPLFRRLLFCVSGC